MFLQVPFSRSLFTVFEVIMVKALSNMFQGLMLSYANYKESNLQDEISDQETVNAKQNDTYAAGYGQGKQRQINYSGISNYESNYLDFSNDSSHLILSSGYGNNWFSEGVGLGFKSVNWFEQAHYNMLLKKLFTQWDLILKSGQSVSQAYQNIADDLGAVTSSMAYSSALKSQMNLQKNLMTKNLDNRFSLAGQVVSLFNTVQNERFESLMQGIKYAAAKGMNYQYQKYINSKSKHFATSKGEASGMMGKFSDAALYNFVQLFEELYRVAIGAVRRTQLANQQDRLMSRAEKQYAGNLSSGSFSESLLYVSNVKKAKHKVNSDIINKIKYYDGFFKTVVANLNDKWQKQLKTS